MIRRQQIKGYLRCLIPITAITISSLAMIGVSYSSAAPRPDAQSAGTTAVVDKAPGTVCLFYPNLTTPGWILGSKYLIDTFKKFMPNMKQLAYNGNNDAATQLGQVQACIASKATVAIISPTVPEEAGAELKDLAAAHIPAISIDQDPDGGPTYAYVWVNFKYVGQWFGQYMTEHLEAQVAARGLPHTPVRLAEMYGDPTFAVYQDFLAGITPYLNALIKKGLVQVVCRANATSWEPTIAQTNMEQCLTKTGNGVDAVLAMNDSVSDGVAAALETQHLLGKVMIYGGHDCDLTTLQRILAGDQIATFRENVVGSDEDAVALAEAALAGKTAQSTGLINYSFDNGYTKGGVPTVRAPEVVVTAANMQQTIVDYGYYTKAQLCTSIATNTAFCKS
jgi:D-xylose transport system substrate-binding protein